MPGRSVVRSLAPSPSRQLSWTFMVITPPIQIASISMADSLILMVLALVVFGPHKLPQIGRQIGKLMYEFRKASNDFKFQMEEEMRAAEEADRRKKEEERVKTLALQTPPPAETPAVSSGSPYSEDAVYPPSAPASDSEHAASAETRSEETHPRIQPPTTGEQVAASSPY